MFSSRLAAYSAPEPRFQLTRHSSPEPAVRHRIPKSTSGLWRRSSRSRHRSTAVRDGSGRVIAAVVLVRWAWPPVRRPASTDRAIDGWTSMVATIGADTQRSHRHTAAHHRPETIPIGDLLFFRPHTNHRTDLPEMDTVATTTEIRRRPPDAPTEAWRLVTWPDLGSLIWVVRIDSH